MLPAAAATFAALAFVAALVFTPAFALEPTATGKMAPSGPDDPATVLVVANAADAVSVRLAKTYVSTRAIPLANLLTLEAPRTEEISRSVFERSILQPIEEHLWKNRIVDRIVYIVLVKGVPLKISGSDGPAGNRASVDSEIALLYRQIITGPYPLNGRMPNPYFAADPALTGGMHIAASPEAPKPEGAHARESDSTATAAEKGQRPWSLYLVTRLDAYTEDEVLALIGRGSAALGSRGRFVLDLRTTGQGDDWMRRAAEVLRVRGADVLLEESAAATAGQKGVMGYCSWGSNDGRYPGRGPCNDWALGAVAIGFVSSDARTFHEPPPAWRPGSFRNPSAFFEGTPQSLLADIIREGVTGGVGNAYEPYLDACARPEILFPAYLAGYNLAEACYMSLPYLSWQAVVVGDPLCRISDR
jgi:hypothetical protein